MRQKIIPILIVLFGFALLSYPFISNYMFEKSAGSTIESYKKQSKTYDQKQKEKALKEAKEYNQDLTRSAVQLKCCAYSFLRLEEKKLPDVQHLVPGSLHLFHDRSAD